MTAIVGVQIGNDAVLAADSLITCNDKPYSAVGQEKIIEKGDYMFAFAGDDQAARIAEYIWQAPRVPKGVNLDKFMMSKVLPSLRKTMIDNGYNPSPEDKDAGFDALMVVNGVIFEIDHYYTYTRDDRGIYCAGTGGAIALGVVASRKPKTIASAVKITETAIKISADYNITVGGEVLVKIQRGK